MTATTRATRADELRNVALNRYEKQVKFLRQAMRREVEPLSPRDAATLFGIATSVAARRITEADEFEAKDGAA